MKTFLLCSMFLAMSSAASAQGFFPPKTSSTTAVGSSTPTLRIGEKIPKTFSVVAESGKVRPLLSYKSALEIMVLGVFSMSCPEDQVRWGQISRFYEDYKDWRVSFVAVNVGPGETSQDLAHRLKKARIQAPLLTESGPSIAHAFGVTHVPAFVMIDEGGYLHYRGPTDKRARVAIETMIAHTSTVRDPEPEMNEGCPIP